jgi:hypothetical protein
MKKSAGGAYKQMSVWEPPHPRNSSRAAWSSLGLISFLEKALLLGMLNIGSPKEPQVGPPVLSEEGLAGWSWGGWR